MSPKETAYIVERLAVRFMAMVAEYERKLLEHRDSFGARTSADARIIEGMRAELQEARRNACLPGESLNEAITRTDRELDTAREQRDSIQVERDALRAEVADLRGTLDMVHASLRIKPGDHIGEAIEALKSLSPKYKVGDKLEWQKLGLSPCSVTVTGIRLVYDCIGEGAEYPVGHSEDELRAIISHDTPAGKEAAEAASKAAQ